MCLGAKVEKYNNASAKICSGLDEKNIKESSALEITMQRRAMGGNDDSNDPVQVGFAQIPNPTLSH